MTINPVGWFEIYVRTWNVRGSSMKRFCKSGWKEYRASSSKCGPFRWPRMLQGGRGSPGQDAGLFLRREHHLDLSQLR